MKNSWDWSVLSGAKNDELIGSLNTISAPYVTVSGGYTNTVSGSYSSVSGGYIRSVTGDYDWQAGGCFRNINSCDHDVFWNHLPPLR